MNELNRQAQLHLHIQYYHRLTSDPRSANFIRKQLIYCPHFVLSPINDYQVRQRHGIERWTN